VAENRYLPDDGGIRFYDITRSFELSGDLQLLGGFSGDETSSDQRDPVAHRTILSGDLLGNDFPDWLQRYDNSLNVVTARDLSAPSVIDGFTIRGGNADFVGSDLLGGGGIFVEGSDLEIRQCRFFENASGTLMPGVGNFGAAVYVKESGTVTIDDCLFQHNRANAGGAIGVLESDEGSVDLLTTDTIFRDNHVPSQHGGAIMFVGRSLHIERCEFSDHTGGYGGVISTTNAEEIIIRDCTFDRNVAHVEPSVLRLDRSDNFDQTPAIIERCTFNDNWTDGGFRGGTVYLIDTIAHMSHCEIRNSYNLRVNPNLNTIEGAGTIFVERELGHRFINCLFADNFAAIVGGVILANAQAEFVNCTLVNNRAGAIDPAASGIAAFGSVFTVDNTILWGNRYGNGRDDDQPGIGGEFAQISLDNSVLSINHSDVEGWTGVHGGTGNIGDDPQFVDEDGLDLHVLTGSPVIDSGNNAAVPGNLLLDLDGNPRIFGVKVDLGAYEHQGPPTGINDGREQPLPTETAFRAVYPNPFNPTVTVEFDLGKRLNIDVSIFDVEGRLVRTLVNEERDQGTHRIQWDGADARGNLVATGVYFARLVAGSNRVFTKKLILLK
jgi:hypothetical protein